MTLIALVIQEYVIAMTKVLDATTAIAIEEDVRQTELVAVTVMIQDAQIVIVKHYALEILPVIVTAMIQAVIVNVIHNVKQIPHVLVMAMCKDVMNSVIVIQIVNVIRYVI